MPHVKEKLQANIGDIVNIGSRTIELVSVANDIITCQLTCKKGGSVIIKSNTAQDAPWITQNPGEGEMETREIQLPIKHKLRIEGWWEFRVFSVDNNVCEVQIIVDG